MTRISLDLANRMIAGALAKGEELCLSPLTVAVTDAGGHLISLQRQDRSSIMRPQVACAKAGGALGIGVSSRKIGVMAADRPIFVAALSELAPQGLLPAAGGVIVVDADGFPLGAIGVTGDTSDNDELCALAGIEAASLVAQE